MITTTNEVLFGKMKLTATPERNFLRIALEGPSGAHPVGDTSSRILELCEIYQNPKILFDVRGLTGNMSTLERFTMSTVFAGKYVLARCMGKIPHCRFAVIGHAPIVDPRKFEESVAINRGLPVKTFTNLDEAVKWLDEKA
jgi:hypothetical protein